MSDGKKGVMRVDKCDTCFLKLTGLSGPLGIQEACFQNHLSSEEWEQCPLTPSDIDAIRKARAGEGRLACVKTYQIDTKCEACGKEIKFESNLFAKVL